MTLGAGVYLTHARAMLQSVEPGYDDVPVDCRPLPFLVRVLAFIVIYLEPTCSDVLKSTLWILTHTRLAPCTQAHEGMQCLQGEH